MFQTTTWKELKDEDRYRFAEAFETKAESDSEAEAILTEIRSSITS